MRLEVEKFFHKIYGINAIFSNQLQHNYSFIQLHWLIWVFTMPLLNLVTNGELSDIVVEIWIWSQKHFVFLPDLPAFNPTINHILLQFPATRPLLLISSLNWARPSPVAPANLRAIASFPCAQTLLWALEELKNHALGVSSLPSADFEERMLKFQIK